MEYIYRPHTINYSVINTAFDIDSNLSTLICGMMKVLLLV